jgi:hypothetical protein
VDAAGGRQILTRVENGRAMHHLRTKADVALRREVERAYRVVSLDEPSDETLETLLNREAATGWAMVALRESRPRRLGDAGRVQLILHKPLAPPVFVFAHVPKTAGTSVMEILLKFASRAYGIGRWQTLLYGTEVDYGNLAPLRPLDPAIRIIAGHLQSRHHGLLEARETFVLSSMRDAFPRFVSVLEQHYRILPQAGSATDQAVLSHAARCAVGLREARGDAAATRRALREYLPKYLTVGYYMLHNDAVWADARLEISEVTELCQRLADELSESDRDDLLGGLAAVSQENRHPKTVLADFSEDEMQLVEEAFKAVFHAECRLVDQLRDCVPSIFEASVWNRFLTTLAGHTAARAETSRSREPAESSLRS